MSEQERKNCISCHTVNPGGGYDSEQGFKCVKCAHNEQWAREAFKGESGQSKLERYEDQKLDFQLN